jgi:outer membrane immunogenic protein
MGRLSVAWIAAVSAAALTQAAFAADIPTKAPIYKAPVSAPAYNWTGFYVGVNGGYSQNQINAMGSGFSPGGVGAAPTSQNFNGSGGFGGGQLGFNYQWQSLVLGTEVDAQLSSIAGNSSLTFITPLNTGAACGTPCLGTRTFNLYMRGFETVRGRIGVAFDRVLVYGTGGWMAARLDETANWIFFAPFGTYPASFSRTGTGGVWGGGLEYAYTDNLIVRAEALGYRLGSDSFTASGTGAGAGNGALYQLTTTGWLVRGGINWKFDWGYRS